MKKNTFTARAIAAGLCASVMALGITTTPAQAKDLPPAGQLLPLVEAPTTVDTFVGQSVQVRKNADGNPDSTLFDPRWAVTQINAESLNDMNAAVPLPMASAPALRSLTGATHTPEKTEGGVVYDFPQVNGVDTFRTLNLWPGDEELPADVTAEFTLNGEKVQAQDLVGKGGVVTATYTVTNNTRHKTSVSYKNLGGKIVKEEMETDQPMVAIAQQLVPQNWGQFNAGSGVVGADGRGNYQVQWIALPFSPMSGNGKAQFGWTAYVPEGEGMVPNIMINVAPLYIPSKHDAAQAKKASGGKTGHGVPGASEISGGIGLAASGGAELVEGIVGIVESIGTGAGTIKKNLPGAVSDTKDALAALEKTLGGGGGGGGSKLPTLPEVIRTLEQTSAELQTAINNLRTNGAQGDTVQDIQKKLNLASTAVGAMQATFVQPSNTALKNSQCSDSLSSLQCVSKYTTPKTTANASYPTVTKALTEIQSTLSDIAKALPTTVGDIEADALEGVKNTVDGITTKLQDLQIFLSTKLLPQTRALTKALGGVFGAINGGIAEIKKGIAGNAGYLSEGASDIGAGIGEIGAGLGDLAPAARALISKILTLVFAGKRALKSAGKEVNHLKATMAGLMQRAHESPLPYGGGLQTVYQPQGAAEVNVEEVSNAILANNDQVPAKYQAYVQPTTKVFGAFQFMFDPANSNKSDTPWRILIGLLAMLIAGIAVPILARRQNKTA